MALNDNAVVACTSDTDCPAQWSCDARIAKCVKGGVPNPRCGDGIADAGEACDCGDDAAQVPADCAGPNSDSVSNRCRLNCTMAACGDGVIDSGEICDDGNVTDGDGCSATCTFERCGDGKQDPGEACDDGDNINGTDAATRRCNASCTSTEVCGNGVVDPAMGELCDCGTDPDPTKLPAGCVAVNDDNGVACTATCRLPRCGDGFMQGSEVCDDGDNVSGSVQSSGTCDAACVSDERCGNGILDPAKGEGCDCGEDALSRPSTCTTINADNGQSCTSSCQLPRCGDGFVQGAEVCDDGDTISGSTQSTGTCNALCDSDESCGNGIIDGANGEECDCGNVTPSANCSGINDNWGAECTQFCLLPRCGDDFAQPGLPGEPDERCDGLDGIATTQVCAGNCTDVCGDNKISGGEICDTGDGGIMPSFGALSCPSYGFHTGQLACDNDCSLVDRSDCSEYCGDGIVNGDSELCDGDDPTAPTCAFYGASGHLMCDANCQPRTDLCFSGGWQVTLSGLTDDLRGIWGSGPSDIWAVGGFMKIIHYDGQQWSTPEDISGFQSYAADIDGTAADDIWVACMNNTVLHYDGTSWSRVDSVAGGEEKVEESGENTGIHVNGSQVWVLAESNVAHFDGASWTSIFDLATELPGGPAQDFSDAWYDGAGKLYVTSFEMGHPLWIYDGTNWSFEALLGNRAVAVDGTGPSDIWVFTLGGPQHFDGVGWSTPIPIAAASEPTALWIDPQGTPWFFDDTGFSHRYNGLDFDTRSTGTPSSLNAAWGTGPADIWAVGAAGTTVHFSGAGWHRDASYTLPAKIGMHGTSPADVWIVGESGAVSHYDGSLWATVDVTSTEFLQDVWVGGPDDVWIVGLNTLASNEQVLRLSGGSWASALVPTSESLHAVWGIGTGDVFVVGVNETVLHWDPTLNTGLGGWNDLSFSLPVQAPPVLVDLYAVWALSPTDIWVGGLPGAVFHYDGTWQQVLEPGLLPGEEPNEIVSAAWGISTSDVWFPREGGEVLHWNGIELEIHFLPVSVKLTDVWGTSPTNIWVGGFSGTLVHYDGASWAVFESSTTANFASLWGASADAMFGVTETAEVFRLDHLLPTVDGGVCPEPPTIYCNSTRGGSTVGEPANIDSYTCGSPSTLYDTLATETTYRLHIPVTGTIVVTLTPVDGDLDLFVIGATSGGQCEPANCIAASRSPVLAQESITLTTAGPVAGRDASAGETIYISVEGAASVFGLEVTCTQNP